MLTKMELFGRLAANPLTFPVESLLFMRSFSLAELAAAIDAAAFLPRVAIKRCINPFLAGLIWNRGVTPGTKICGVDVVRVMILDATPDGADDLYGVAVIVFCTVFNRMYFGVTGSCLIGDDFIISLADCPLTGLDADEMPESSENAETLSLHGSLSGVLDRLEWPSLIGDIIVWRWSMPASSTKSLSVWSNILVALANFIRCSRSRCSTAFISAWMRFNGSSFCESKLQQIFFWLIHLSHGNNYKLKCHNEWYIGFFSRCLDLNHKQVCLSSI